MISLYVMCNNCICMVQVIINPLTVDEGGECLLGPENLLLLDVDSMEEALQLELLREPQHGTVQLGGLPLKPGQTFTPNDLKGLKVRSDIHSSLHVMWDYNIRFHNLLFSCVQQTRSDKLISGLLLSAKRKDRMCN